MEIYFLPSILPPREIQIVCGIKMNLRYITCSDIREDVPVRDAIELLNISPKVELGIQAHPSAMSRGMPRFEWFTELIRKSREANALCNIALHVNYDWCSKICNNPNWGFPSELSQYIGRVPYGKSEPLIRRWQFNIGDSTHGFDAEKLASFTKLRSPLHEFIFPYNDKTRNYVSDLSEFKRSRFSLFYDSSYGIGKLPEKWSAPVYKNRPMGYAGGLGPDNVADNLEKIAAVCPQNYTTWIDAEGQLMKPGTRQFDIERAARYVQNALDWERHR